TSAATRGLLHGSTPAERAPIFSAIYLICYGGAAFPSLISGQLSNAFSLPQIALGYGGLAVVATLFTVLSARNPHTDTTGHATCAARMRPEEVFVAAGTCPHPLTYKGIESLAEDAIGYIDELV